MGEPTDSRKTALATAAEEAMAVDTLGGRVHVRWDERAQATPHGQLVFFAEFLATAGVFERWVQECPLSYTSPNGSAKKDVLGTLMLGILAGSKRYAHLARMQGDAVATRALGMDGLVSEDSSNYGGKLDPWQPLRPLPPAAGSCHPSGSPRAGGASTCQPPGSLEP